MGQTVCVHCLRPETSVIVAALAVVAPIDPIKLMAAITLQRAKREQQEQKKKRKKESSRKEKSARRMQKRKLFYGRHTVCAD